MVNSHPTANSFPRAMLPRKIGIGYRNSKMRKTLLKHRHINHSAFSGWNKE